MAGEVTPEDILRIHTRLDEVVRSQTDMAVNQAKTAVILERMDKSLEQQNQDRAKTCPQVASINLALDVAYALGGKDDPVGGAVTLAHRTGIMWNVGKWVMAVIVPAAVIPSLMWFFGWLGHIVARAISII